MLRITIVALLLTLMCGAGGCANNEAGLRKRAAEYYSYMLGLSPRTEYSSFLSPAYRKSFTKTGLQQLNTELGAAQASTRYKPAQAKHVAVALKGRFGYSNIGNELGQAYASIGPVRWLRVGSKWYLYLSSKAERDAYGPFPSDASPPAPPVPEAK
jgi:hypothetical protein